MSAPARVVDGAAARSIAAATETRAVARLAGGPVPYTLRRSPRARGVRVVIHTERGVVVTVPAGRLGQASGERRAVDLLRAREAWLRRHLERDARLRAVLAERGGARDGGQVPFLGQLHRVRIVAAPVGQRRSSVERIGAEDGDELVVRRATRDRRPDHAIVEGWLRDRARATIDRAVRIHAPALGVTPVAVAVRDQRSRWGSASRAGRLSFSWRLILAPPEALDTVVVHELAHLQVFGHGPTFWSVVASRRPDHLTWRRWLHDHAIELHTALDPRPTPDPEPAIAPS